MPDLIYEVHNHLARITMNRPENLNCFSEEMIHLWTEALEDIRDRDDVNAVLLFDIFDMGIYPIINDFFSRLIIHRQRNT